MAEKMPELGQRRFAADKVENALVLVGLEAVFGDKLRCDPDIVRYHATASRTLSKSARPSVAPFSGSIMFSGMRHHAEDIAALIENAGDVVQRAVRVGAFGVAQAHAAFAFEAPQRFRRR